VAGVARSHGPYSAIKVVLIGRAEALYAEEKPCGVRVGTFLRLHRHRGPPATEMRERALTR
jgi:hypothetical protein